MKEKKVSVLVVGRHPFDGVAAGFPEFVQENITFASVRQAMDVITSPEWDVIILQMTPPVVVAAAAEVLKTAGGNPHVDLPHVGMVESVPRPEKRGTTQMFKRNCMCMGEFDNATEVAELVEVVNPRAKVTVDGAMVVVAVEPPMPFEFKEIKWLW